MPERKTIDLTTRPGPAPVIHLGVVSHPAGQRMVGLQITSADGTREVGVLLTAAGAREIGDCLQSLAARVDGTPRQGN